MGLGQTMLTSLFLVLLTIAVMNANKMIVDQDYNYYHHKALEQSAILANELLDEISKKVYDSDVDTSVYGYLNRWDFDWSLGPSNAAKNYVNPSGKPDSAIATRSYKSIRSTDGNYFDDMDDYKGYLRAVNTTDINGFRLSVNVYYVSETNPNNPSTTPTYLKKVDVTVTQSVYLKKGVTYSRVIAY